MLRKRIARAKALLSRGEQPVIEIALQCGFSDQSHFSKTFRQVVGVTPSEFRGGGDQGRKREP